MKVGVQSRNAKQKRKANFALLLALLRSILFRRLLAFIC